MTKPTNPRPEAAPAAAAARRRFWSGPWPALLLGVLCVANSLTNDFAYDDRALVLRNSRIRSLTDLRALWLSDWWRLVENAAEANPQRDRLYRPLTMFTFALNYAVHAYHPAGYHLVNLGLHAAVCLLVWHFTRRLTADRAVAGVAAALFAVHPIHAEAVANVVGRAELLAALFLLLGLLILLPTDGVPSSRRALWAAPAFFTALLAKETAVCYPALALLVLYVRQRGHARPWRWWLTHAAGLLLPLLVYFPLRYVALDQQLFRALPVDVLMNPLVVATPMERVWGALTVLGQYTRLLVIPDRLSADYGIAILDPRRGFTILTLVGLLAAGGLAVAVLGFVRRGPLWRQLAPLAALSLASYILISNTVLLIGVALAERLFYWPSVPVFVLTAVAVVEFWRRQCGPGRALAGGARLLRVLGVLLLATLGLRSVARNADWANNITLFTRDFATHPQGAHLNKGCALELIKLWHDPDSAENDHEKVWAVARQHLSALDLWRDDWTPAQKRQALLEAAQWHLDHALEIHPGYADALALRGRVRAQLGHVDDALLDTEAALQLDPALQDARQTLARLLYGADAERRLTALQARAREHPDDAVCRFELGQMLLEYGRYSQAQTQLEQAVALAPQNVPALRRLGEVLALRQQRLQAIEMFKRVLALTPDDWEAHANLATLLSDRDPAATLEHAKRAYASKPTEPRNGINLAEAYALNGQKAAAVELLAHVERQLDVDDPLRRVLVERLAVLRQR